MTVPRNSDSEAVQQPRDALAVVRELLDAARDPDFIDLTLRFTEPGQGHSAITGSARIRPTADSEFTVYLRLDNPNADSLTAICDRVILEEHSRFLAKAATGNEVCLCFKID